MTHEEAQATAATGDQLITVMSVTEAARRYRASEADILRWIRTGLIRARKIGGQWYIIKEATMAETITETGEMLYRGDCPGRIKGRHGFASMDPERQREIARLGGKASHEKGTAHEWTSEEAREAGRKGGAIVAARPGHMATIGRTGGSR